MTHFDFVRGIFDGVFGTTLTIARAKSDRLLAIHPRSLRLRITPAEAEMLSSPPRMPLAGD
jgi:hypothetical protein